MDSYSSHLVATVRNSNACHISDNIVGDNDTEVNKYLMPVSKRQQGGNALTIAKRTG